MLANAFKTAAELGISEREVAALVKVLGMLERGEMIHANHKPCSGFGREITGHFNMAFHNTVTECGTVLCIAGAASLLMGGPNVFYGTQTPAVRRLCYPDHSCGGWEKITPEQAAIALRNYLTTGEPRWAEALAE